MFEPMNVYALLTILITQFLVIIVPIICRLVENRPEIKRIKQQIADKKEQIETNKNALINICYSNLEWQLKQPLIDFYKDELNKLKAEIIKLNDELPKRQRENIKLNVSEILTAVEKLKTKMSAKGGVIVND